MQINFMEGNTILSLSDLLQKKLEIPYYQRPYKWKEENVIQLLNDIKEAMFRSKSSYRIGTTILHQDNDKFNIVDGQQRLVTLSLIIHQLKPDYAGGLLSSHFKHDISKANLKTNYHKIAEWLKLNLSDTERKAFLGYLLAKCKFVVLVLSDISEAFQLFDSQNARGKPLEAYDLLKAYHLREMEHNTDKEKLDCVQTWEKQAETNLGEVIGTYLFRIRKWAKGGDAGHFSKEHIGEFKGISLHQHKNFPYLKPYLLNDAAIVHLDKNPIYTALHHAPTYPFQITQMILNGKRFFEYVTFYTHLLHFLFKDKGDNTLHEFYKVNCKYNGHWRKGDTYVRELYKGIVLFYYDKFGQEEFEKYYKLLYTYSYKLRLEKKSVRYTSIDAYLRGEKVFQKIEKAYFPYQFLAFLQPFKAKPQTIHYAIEQVIQNFE